MTVKELINILQQIEDKDRLIVVNEKISDEYVVATEAVEQDSLGLLYYDQEESGFKERVVDCVVIE